MESCVSFVGWADYKKGSGKINIESDIMKNGIGMAQNTLLGSFSKKKKKKNTST